MFPWCPEEVFGGWKIAERAGFPLIVATGALGCRCLGYGSVAGLALGMLLVSLPAIPRWVSARAA